MTEKNEGLSSETVGEQEEQNTFWGRMKRFLTRKEDEMQTKEEIETKYENNKTVHGESNLEFEKVKSNAPIDKAEISVELKKRDEVERDYDRLFTRFPDKNTEHNGDSWLFLGKFLLDKHSMRHALPGNLLVTEPRRSVDNGPLAQIAEEGDETKAPLARPEEEDEDDRILDVIEDRYTNGTKNEYINGHHSQYNNGKENKDSHSDGIEALKQKFFETRRIIGYEVKAAGNNASSLSGWESSSSSEATPEITNQRHPTDSDSDSWLSEMDKPTSPRRCKVKCTISTEMVVNKPRKQSASSERSNSTDKHEDEIPYDVDDDSDTSDETSDQTNDGDDDNVRCRTVPKRQRKVFVSAKKKPSDAENAVIDLDDASFEEWFAVGNKQRTSQKSPLRSPILEEPVEPTDGKVDVEKEVDFIKLLEDMDKQGKKNHEQDAGEPGRLPCESDFKRLRAWDEEPTEWWTNTKKTRDYDVWYKPMKEGTITRIVVPFMRIPYKDAVRLISDWDYRRVWDKTFSKIEVIKKDGAEKLIHCPLSKKCDLTLAVRDKNYKNDPSFITTWRRHNTQPSSPKDKRQSKILEFDTRTCGILLCPAENEAEEVGTRLSIICQLTGPTDHVIKNTYLAGDPQRWLKNLQKYSERERKQQQFKVVKL
ncbi:uncharacterized protein LOC116621114 isoform X2 [Nematostella vectensis]|uniref:uncharacterized protein LOC116621114 isoform X2 n=1 Tax=Nematostella vectensis TaxID=45351 RepID=UPI0013902451|nr:uncharacterized protein LOC116621114 isoform X2 [Nematostella vectensis]